jgi:alkylation response protein AidB-like acyl-CoA dehydrogenase
LSGVLLFLIMDCKKMGNAVADSENIVAQTAERIFADLADAQTINHDKKGGWKAPLWTALSEAGLPLSWVSEDCGGSGASLAEGFSVLSAAGRFAIGVPLAETMLAGWLLSQAKIASPEGEMTVAPAGPKDRITLGGDGTLSGRARDTPFAKDAKHIAVLARGDGGVSIALVKAGDCRIEAGLNLGGDGSDTVTFNGVAPIAIAPAPRRFDQTSLLLMGAVARSLQIAGALESMLDISVRYSNERVAFEKKISKFQAKRRLPRSAARRRPKRARQSHTRCMARSASRSSTSCIATRCGRWHGAMISAPRAIGRSNLASASQRAAPKSCGRWWPRAEYVDEYEKGEGFVSIDRP